MRVEPGLKDDGSSGAVHALAERTLAPTAVPQAAAGFERGEPLVGKLDGEARSAGERVGETPGAPGRRPLVTLEGARQTDDEAVDVFGFRERRERLDRSSRVSPVHERPRMGYQAELVGDGDADTHFADVYGDRAHREVLPRRDAVPGTRSPVSWVLLGLELDRTSIPDDKRAPLP